jgi:hypothetical protein
MRDEISREDRKKIIDSVVASEREKVKQQERDLGQLIDALSKYRTSQGALHDCLVNYLTIYHVKQKNLAQLLGLSLQEVRIILSSAVRPTGSSVSSPRESSIALTDVTA